MENESLQLRSEGLVKIYGKRTVVNNVTFNVRQGEIVGLLGPNGAGKTTSFYMTTGLVLPNDGHIFLGDEEITDLPVYKRARLGIGYLAQEASVFRKMSVEDNIASVLEMTNKTKEEQREKLESLITEFHLEKVRKNLGDQLSGGERRRTEIARCLAIDPKFIMLDEPFAGVDPIAVEDIQYIVWKLKQRNIGVLITDHNVEETLCITDRAYLLFEGQILFHGTPQELSVNPVVLDKYLTRNFVLRFKDFQLAGDIEQEVLSSTSGSDENTMTDLTKVKPSHYTLSSSLFTQEEGLHFSLPAHSLSILRIPVENVTPELKPEPTEDDWIDITDQLVNPAFAQGRTGWQGTSFLDAPGTVAEFWNQTFDAYQILQNMPAGSYRFVIDGFYRNGNIANAWTTHSNGTEQLNAKLYIVGDGEAVQTPFMSLFDEAVPFSYSPYTYPDNVTQANIAFNVKGAYKRNSVETTLSTDDGQLTVGMQKTVAVGSDWTCFDNARLYYRKPFNPDGIKILPKRNSGDGTSIYNLAGQRMSKKQRGINIVNGKKVLK